MYYILWVTRRAVAISIITMLLIKSLKDLFVIMITIYEPIVNVSFYQCEFVYTMLVR